MGPGELACVAYMTDQTLSGDAPGADAALYDRLVERARAGDNSAFEQLVVITRRRVLRVAWQMLRHEEDARDAAQEVFLRAYRYLHSFRRGQDFPAWLYGITVNVCRDLARKSNARRELFTSYEEGRDSGLLDNLPGPESADAAAISGQRRELVTRALASLTERERAALVLRDLEGLSTNEVALALGSRPATVRTQLSSARSKVKTFCERLLRTGRKD